MSSRRTSLASGISLYERNLWWQQETIASLGREEASDHVRILLVSPEHGRGWREALGKHAARHPEITGLGPGGGRGCGADLQCCAARTAGRFHPADVAEQQSARLRGRAQRPRHAGKTPAGASECTCLLEPHGSVGCQ